jgi:hypothetical protein
VKKPGVAYNRWRYQTRLFIAMGELYGQTGEGKKGLGFIRSAMLLAERHGVRKHQARALLVKGRLLRQTLPSLSRRSLEEALSLSEKMGTRLLSGRIQQELEADSRPPHPHAPENPKVGIEQPKRFKT